MEEPLSTIWLRKTEELSPRVFSNLFRVAVFDKNEWLSKVRINQSESFSGATKKVQKRKVLGATI